ncbi:hypothetical protein [Ruegeria sp.]|uniref:hypothetical protein n=1 Tax=Ruegeria sp. TaxID=1879320 RepID=UPI0023207393|nr:hypothetical protein [Ruegeria sp.]MDA7963549.1 hypothetical protein [Ruegeria sp.]
MVIRPVRDARKGRLQWLARGVSSHATRAYCASLGRGHSVAVCGYPRSGTSWISAVLAGYYDLPVPRHYGWPQFYPQVLHGHDLRLGGMQRVFYMVRSPFQLFPSLFVKRYGITCPTPQDRARFTDFLQAELNRPYEAPCPWADHIARAVSRYGAKAILTYTADPDAMTDELAQRIGRIDGHCDRPRLAALVANRPSGRRAPTTSTPDTARRFNWFSTEANSLIQTELQRLNMLGADPHLAEMLGLP